MRRLFLMAATLLIGTSALAQKAEKPPLTAVYTYADIADLSLASSHIAHVKIKKAKKLSKKLAQGVPPGAIRYLMTAEVIALIRGDGGMEPRISYLVDVPTDSRGRGTLATKGEALIFGQPGRPGEIQLVAPDAQIPYSIEAGTMVRKIASDSLRRESPPLVKGVESAFFTAGTLPGEGVTQIFLDAARPVSISIEHAPNAPANWFVSMGDIVAEGRTPPRRNTLLWYRLACFLPAVLPDDVASALEPDQAATIKADYGLVMSSLGGCKRARRQF